MKAIQNLLFFVNILFAVALFVSYLVGFTNPEVNIIPSVMGLFFAPLVVVNLVFLVWWLLFSYKKAALSLLVLALGFGQVSRFYQFSGNDLPDEQNAIHLLSYNVRLFGLYSWQDNTKIRDSIVDFIEEENPDILCLQEYYRDKAERFKTGSIIRKVLGEVNIHESFSAAPDKNQRFGMATLIKYPIVNKGEILFENSFNLAQFTDFVFETDTFRIYNVHLQSIHFDEANYDDVDELVLSDIDKEKLSKLNSLMKKVTYATKRRVPQVNSLSSHIQTSPYPVIVCGDFNDPVCSYSYSQLSTDLNDAFKSSGKGFGISFQRSLLKMRIDHILHADDFNSFAFETKKLKFSDHFPVSCYLSRKED